MVTAGFEATVAPLGTALTADQLALMWRMADEPILCFDGDDAGRRAAFRALDLALPLVAPGKSLKLAALPDAQDPDDLVRSGGREAVDDVLAAACPLADVLWAREIEAGPFTTPERRAALEARLAEVTATIADETVRRYYRQDFASRLGRCARAAEVATRRRPAENLSWESRRWRPKKAAGTAAISATSANQKPVPSHCGQHAGRDLLERSARRPPPPAATRSRRRRPMGPPPCPAPAGPARRPRAGSWPRGWWSPPAGTGRTRRCPVTVSDREPLGQRDRRVLGHRVRRGARAGSAVRRRMP